MQNDKIFIVMASQGDYDDRRDWAHCYYEDQISADIAACILNVREEVRIESLEESGRLYDIEYNLIAKKFGYTEDDWLSPDFEISPEYWEEVSLLSSKYNLDLDRIFYYVREVSHGA